MAKWLAVSDGERLHQSCTKRNILVIMIVVVEQSFHQKDEMAFL
jgi:hypothetical protein